MYKNNSYKSNLHHMNDSDHITTTETDSSSSSNS